MGMEDGVKGSCFLFWEFSPFGIPTSFSSEALWGVVYVLATINQPGAT
jgi:hypothetical protein